MSGKKPAELLKEYRIRAGVSAADAARACGFKGDNPTAGYSAYENVTKRGDKLVPNEKIIQPLLKLLVGKGHPSVTVEDLLSISDAKNLPQMLESVARQNEIGRSLTDGGETRPAMNVPNVGTSARHVPIKYRVEAGVYMSEDASSRRRYGWSPFVFSPDFPEDRQFACSIVDENVGELFPPGTVLHCAEISEFNVDAIAGRYVMVRKRLNGDVPVVSIALGQRGKGDRKEELYDLGGRTTSGEVFAVVLAKYRKL